MTIRTKAGADTVLNFKRGASDTNIVFFTVTKSAKQYTGATYRGWVYSNSNGTGIIGAISGNYGYSLTGTDFSGSFNSEPNNVIVKVGGVYLENKNGTLTKRTIVADTTVSVPDVHYSLIKISN